MKQVCRLILLLLTSTLGASVDLMVFTYDRPLQFEALVRSIKERMSGYDTIHVIYRVSSDAYDEAYQECFEGFADLPLVLHKQGISPYADFKPMVMDILRSSSADHILFSVDDSVVTDFVDLGHAAFELNSLGAYTFHLRMGENINYSYMIGEPSPVPALLKPCAGIYKWSFAGASREWSYPNTVDMGMYRRKECLYVFDRLRFTRPNNLEGEWARRANKNNFGLCYTHSKMLTLPLNVVSEDNKNVHMNLYTSAELLRMFQEGLRLDIESLYAVRSRSPHAGDLVPQFQNS